MKTPWLLVVSALLSAFIAPPAAEAGVVINEVMYQRAGIPEDPTGEFIELHNADAVPVSVAGWQLTAGVAFTMPAGTTIPAGGYLVVAANVAAFQGNYPGVANVVGGWTGALSNSGEDIELSDAAGLVRDAVDYADEGDWATRVREGFFNGWAWQSLADGGGRSLELRNAAVANGNGQNWGASSAAGGTPGAVNSLAVANVAPLIRKVRHSPAVPTSAQEVTISCQLTDETAAAGLTATLFWRDASTTAPGSFISAPMAGDGTGGFAAILDEMPPGTIVEFYVQAMDGALARTWPAPTSEGQNANCQYQVDDQPSSATDSVYRLILTAAENNAFNTVPSNSDRQFNQTLIVTRGSEVDIRYRSSMRIRGNSSRTYVFKPLRISIPGDDRLDGLTAFNLAPKAPFLQHLGMRLLQATGLRSFDTIPVELRRNGIESTTSTGSTPDFGKWVRIEEINGDMSDSHWPTADGGNLYKKGRPDEFWRSTQPAPGNPDGLLDGWSKQNNGAANDWSDLTGFFQTWQNAAAPHFPGAPAGDVSAVAWAGTTFSAAEIASVETVADLDQWARWFAVMTIMQDFETNISNGQDDDYNCYFRPSAGGQRRMELLAHDLDTIFGLGDTPQPPTARGLFDMSDNSSVFRPLLPLFGDDDAAGNADFRAKYFTALRELYGTVCDADTSVNPNPPFYRFVENHLTGWAPTGTINAIKSFATQRQVHLLGLIGSGAIAPPVATSAATLTSAHGNLMISEVLARNVAAVNVAGAFPDMLELHNAGATEVILGGMSLTDDPALPAKFVFPAGTTLAAGAYLFLYADESTAAGHLPFSLANGGDRVELRQPATSGGALIDSVVFGVQAVDFSIGRTGANLETWTLCTPTFGGANVAVTAFAAPGSLRINEWLGNIDYQVEDDFVEVSNAAALPVALSGMSVTDDFINFPARAFPPLSFIGPASFQRFEAKGSAASPGDATELPFKINSTFGSLALLGQNGALVDRVDIVSQFPDVSRGRSPDGAPTLASFGLPTSVPTPGASNAVPAAIIALYNNLRISEILFKPNDLEFIELQNIGSTALDISGVRFTTGIGYTFAPGTTLAPGAFIVVCANRAAFQAQFTGPVPLAPGIFTGSLGNTDETIALRPPQPWDANILNFRYEAAWYPATENGASLTVSDVHTTPARDWDLKSTWSPSTVLYGSPGREAPPVIFSPLTAAVLAGEPFSYQIDATKFPTSFNATPLPAGLAVNTATGFISGIPTTAGTFNITISATNASGTGSETLVLTVTIPPMPVITSAGSASGTINEVFSTYQITATNNPTSFGATGLAPGLAVNATTGAITGTPTSEGTFNATISATNAGGTGSLALTISITGSGPLAAFVWGSVPASQQTGVPFAATLRAVDDKGRTVLGFSGPVNLSAGAGRAPVTIGTGTENWNYPLRTFWHDSRTQSIYLASEIGAAGTINSLALDVTTIPGQIMNNWTIRVKHTALAGYTTNSWESAGWTTAHQSNQPRGATGLVTFTFTSPFIYNGTSNLFVDFSHNNTEYTNDGMVRSTATATNRSLVFFTDSGNGDPLAWAGTSNPTPEAVPRIPNIRLTFNQTVTAMTPTTAANFVNGIWSGNVSVNQPGTGVMLRAEDSSGKKGESTPFNVISPPPPVISSPSGILTVIGRPFSYQILANNGPLSFGATNLPAGLTVNTATGLISGVPTVAASNPTVGLSATNAVGTGSKTISILVMADADGDGMGDAWEGAYGLSSSNAADAALDKDGDGQSNLAEWLAGTLPNNRTNAFRITSQQIVGNDIVLTWTSVSGKRYRVVTRAALGSGGWVELTSAPLTPITTTTTFTHTGALTGSGSQFYRVEVVP